MPNHTTSDAVVRFRQAQAGDAESLAPKRRLRKSPRQPKTRQISSDFGLFMCLKYLDQDFRSLGSVSPTAC